jgi:hypothetical protein
MLLGPLRESVIEQREDGTVATHYNKDM